MPRNQASSRIRPSIVLSSLCSRSPVYPDILVCSCPGAFTIPSVTVPGTFPRISQINMSIVFFQLQFKLVSVKNGNVFSDIGQRVTSSSRNVYDILESRVSLKTNLSLVKMLRLQVYFSKELRDLLEKMVSAKFMYKIHL